MVRSKCGMSRLFYPHAHPEGKGGAREGLLVIALFSAECRGAARRRPWSPASFRGRVSGNASQGIRPSGLVADDQHSQAACQPAHTFVDPIRRRVGGCTTLNDLPRWTARKRPEPRSVHPAGPVDRDPDGHADERGVEGARGLGVYGLFLLYGLFLDSPRAWAHTSGGFSLTLALARPIIGGMGGLQC